VLKESIIEVIFKADKKIPVVKSLGIDDEDVIIRRIINPSGKSRAFVNETPVTLSALSEISKALLDIHGQHEHQSLLSEKDRWILLIVSETS